MGETNLKRIMSSAYMKSLGDRKTLNKSKIKILKSKIPWMESWGTPEKNSTRRREKRKRIIFEDFSAACDL